MKEFTAGEYKMRNGKIAVVIGEIPNPLYDHCCLSGYGAYDIGGGNIILAWTKSGQFNVSGIKHDFDLIPNTKKIESWGFVYWCSGRRQHVEYDNERSVIVLRNHFANVQGYPCSEVFKYPTLEVEVWHAL